eukprot:symbB.v1.2.005236.t1/scaffold302.1/size234775/5
MKVSEDRKTFKALKRLTMLARVVGLIPGGNGPGDMGLGPLSSQLLVPPRDLAKAFVQDDMTAFDWMCGEQGATESLEKGPAAVPEPLSSAMQRSGLAHSSSLSSADGTLPRPTSQYQHSGSLGSGDGTLGIPRKMSLGHSSSVSSADGTLAVPRPGGTINRGSSLGSGDGTLGLPRLLGLSHSNSNLSRQGMHHSASLSSGSDNNCDSHTALLRSDGQAVAFGKNDFGQCNIPPLPDKVSYTQVSAGGSHTVLLRSDGQAVACGKNNFGQCDIEKLPNEMFYTQVSAGKSHTVLLRSDGEALAFGHRSNGRCTIPPLPHGVYYVQVSAGQIHSVLLRSDGLPTFCGEEAKLWAVGRRIDSKVLQVSAGGCDPCGCQIALLQTDGTVDAGQTIPRLPEGISYTQVSAGGGHMVFLRSDGQAEAFGDYQCGQCNIPHHSDYTYIYDSPTFFRSRVLQLHGTAGDKGKDEKMDFVDLICFALDGSEALRLAMLMSDLALDVIVKVADGIATSPSNLRILLPDGRLMATVYEPSFQPSVYPFFLEKNISYHSSCCCLTTASRLGLRRSSSNCSTGPDLSYLGRRLGLLRGSSNSSHLAEEGGRRPLGLYRGTSTTSSNNDSETARKMGYNRSTSNFSCFSATSLASFNQKHGISSVESPSFLQFLATVHEAGLKVPRGNQPPKRLCSIKEHSLDDAFNNRIEVEEMADDKMSYYSAQEMGKASVFDLITSQGSVTLSTRCLKTQAAWQRSLIEQQRSLLVLVSRKLHQAEEKTKLDIAVSEDQRELLRNFRKIVTRTVESSEEPVDIIASKDLYVIIVETCPVLRGEVSQLCQLLEYPCKAYASLTAAASEISNIMESTGDSGGSSPTFLVLLGTSWLDRDLPYQFKQEFVYVTLTSKAEEFEQVGNELCASSESQIRSVLRERGIREYLLHPLSLEDMRRTVDAALQRRWAEEFLVCETLGRGSSGVVHRVKRLRDGHIFAMKEVPTRLLREKERQSLLQEVSLMQQFNWPTIISLVCAWENPQQRLHYIVMPFSEGGSLKMRVSHSLQSLVADTEGPSCSRSNSSLSLRGQHLGAWYVQSLHGLSFLHYHGILHRDIKPDNLMLGHGGLSLQICDLGSAMRLPNRGDSEAFVEAPVTTPLYSAPEVSKWKRCYAASDMWSLGATFYEVVSLQSLAPPSNPQETIAWLDDLVDGGPVYPEGQLRGAVGRRRDPNPFWSERAQEGWNVAMARPSDLPTEEEAVEMGVLPPVPGGDRDPDLEVRSGRGISSSRAVEDRPRSSQGISVERKRPLKFATPASWNGSTGSGKGRAAKKASESTSDRAQDDLERAMEKEVFMQLQDENMRLREELTKMQHMQVESGQQSVWSAVSEPPKREMDDELRFTPNGTRVPDGPPPMDLTEKAEMIPPWPLGSYEKVEMTGPCSNVFSGYVQGLPRQKGTLYDEDPGRGSGTRHVLPDGGSRTRHEHSDGGSRTRHELLEGGSGTRHVLPEPAGLPGDGPRARQAHQEGDFANGVVSPAEAKAMWLERELASLRQAIAEEGKSHTLKTSSYWSQPFVSGKDRVLHPGEVQGSGDHRDNRAQHLQPGHLGEVRAQHLQPGLWEGDRAQQWHQDQGVPSGAGRHQDLPELQAGDLSPLVLGDWLEMIAPVMKDLSPQAHRWWELVELEAKGYYEQWRVATPMARLHIKPRCQAVEKNPTLQRTEQRGISLLVRAIPSSMRETIVVERLMTSTGILFTLLKNYQPGGRGERTTLLKELSNPKYGKSLNDAATTLRSWRRFFRRTEEIGAVLPDPSVLLKALETPNQMVSKVDAQATFRLSQARVSLDIDASPTTTSVWDFSECLLAELDSLILLQGVEVQNKPTECKTPTKRGGAAFGGLPMAADKANDVVTRMTGRAWTISHRDVSCVRLRDIASRTVRLDSKVTVPLLGGVVMEEETNKEKNNLDLDKEEEVNPIQNPRAKANLEALEMERASVRAMQGSSTTSSAPATSTAPSVAGSASEQELMGEVASLLKSLSVGEGNPNPQLSAVRLARILNQDKAVLIDGGATHCLRNPHSREEYLNHAEEVRVDLAAGSVRMRQDTGTGTLYSQARFGRFSAIYAGPPCKTEWREDDYALHGGHGYPSFLCWPETDRVLVAYSDVIEVRVDQGALGHKRKKPTTLVTNIHEVKLLNGLQDSSVQRPWPTSLQARMEESRSLAEWAPELKKLLLSVAIRVHRGQPPLRLRTTVPRMNALTAAERKDMEMWQNHINQEHLPMRRDCHDCLLAMGRDRPRRRQVLLDWMLHPSSVTRRGSLIPEEYHDYNLEANEKALAELDQVDAYLAEMEQQLEQHHEEEERERNIFCETEQDPPRLASENVPDPAGSHQKEEGDPEEAHQEEIEGVFGKEERKEALPEVLVRELDLQNARWKNKIAELKEVEVVNLTLAVPLRSRHATEVLRAVSSLYVRLRGLVLPIYRLHSDRAREFTGKLMRDWILSHDMEHTTTAAYESAGNGRVESEIAHLKHHTKLLLTTARASATYWPMALRHASEYRFRKTLEQIEADGKWMRSTVVVQPAEHPELRPELPLEEQAELMDNASIAMSEDQQAVMAPNQVDEAGQPVVDLEHIDQDDQVQWIPKRRFHSKKPLIPGSEDAALRMRLLCSNRGECNQEVPNSWEGSSHPTTSLNQCTSFDKEEALGKAWATLEHLHLRKLETEERQLTTGDQPSLEVIAKIEEQCKDIEKRIEESEALQKADEEEVLVNQPVPLEEVRRNLPQWKEALKKEYDSLKGYGAIRPIGSKEYTELQEQYEVVESLPTMLVAVKKPPMKLKARVVACGNHAQEATGYQDSFPPGSEKIDTRTGHDPVTPPAILREAQLLQLQGERWVVEKAMYGLTESPKDWGDYRNMRMSSMKWSSQGFQRWLRRSPEPHLWEVCQQDVVTEESQPSVICHVAVYVDDLMVTGKREDARDVMDQLAKTFQMTSPEAVSETKEVTFCGYQIQKTRTGFALHQQKYVQEVLQKHGVQSSESVPCLKISDGPEEQDPAREDIKQAQIVTGELGCMADVLKYLHGSMGWGLNYTRIDDPTVLNVLGDASYAPPHEGYRSVQGAIYMHGSNVLMWSSSRQSFITQSTAEAELLAYNESAQGAESVAHLLECFDQKVARRLIGDSKFRDMLFMKDCGSFDVEENIKSAPAIKTCTQERPGMYLRDLGCGLVGAGSALLMTGHKKLALMLVASGAALYWSKEGKRPASKAIEQRPQKSPENEGGQGQKYVEKGGAAHLKDEDRAGTIKKEDSSGLMSQAQSNRQKVQADEKMKEELTKEANRRIRALEERVDALVTDNASYVASNPMPTPMSSTRMVEDGMQRALVPPSRPYRALDGTVEPPGDHRAVMGSHGAWSPPPGLSQPVFGGHPSTSWSRPLARAGISGSATRTNKGSDGSIRDLQKQLEDLASQAGISGDYDFQGHGELQDVLQIQAVDRPSAAAILASSSNMSVLRSAMAVSRSTTSEVDQHMKETKRLLQKSLQAQGLRSRSICKL